MAYLPKYGTLRLIASQGVGSISQRGSNVGLSQARICIQQVSLCSTLARLADDEFYFQDSLAFFALSAVKLLIDAKSKI